MRLTSCGGRSTDGRVLGGRIEERLKQFIGEVVDEEFPSSRSPLPILWTNSYFVGTTGGAPLAAVERYVEQQKGR